MHIGISAIVVSSALGNRIARGCRPEQTFGAARDCLAEIAGPPASQPAAKLGLRENWRQFSLLVLVYAFVGGMVGLERTVVPLVGSEELRLSSATVIASFIASFGIAKAFKNLVSGQLADSWGRKPVLVLGWAVGLPVPFMIIGATSWNWIVAANVLLGTSQGLASTDWKAAVGTATARSPARRDG